MSLQKKINKLKRMIILTLLLIKDWILKITYIL